LESIEEEIVNAGGAIILITFIVSESIKSGIKKLLATNNSKLNSWSFIRITHFFTE
jgi:hypothetical protein